MKQCCASQGRCRFSPTAIGWVLLGATCLLCAAGVPLHGQSATDEKLVQQVQDLTDAMARTQTQLEQSQRELEQMRTQLVALQKQMAQRDHATAEPSAAQLSAAVEEIREQQSLQESQIATHEQSKVESESKYPIKLSGLVLLTGFVNTRQTDAPDNPTIVMPGPGSTGATIRQTELGLDGRGPHLFGASSHADLRVDFYGNALSTANGATNAYTGGLIRLRTAHAALQWERTEAFFSIDRTILSPNAPASLTAVAIPALAWSGNLWSWNPQVGVTHDFAFSNSRRVRTQAAFIDIANPPALYNLNLSPENPYLTDPSTAERSRWPGIESRLALVGADSERGLQLGMGGLFAPHMTPGGKRFDSWAATLDYRVPFTKYFELSGSAYRGLALGGLGGGTSKDYVFYISPVFPYKYYFQALDNVGGWSQLKARPSNHLELNLAFGTDQTFAGQLRPYAVESTSAYFNLSRNRTYTGNVIYSPSAFLLFSLEYRHLQSSPVSGSTTEGDVIGIATGYRF